MLRLLISVLACATLLPVTIALATPVPSGTITTIAGNGQLGFSGDGGPATSATLIVPVGLAFGRDGTLYFNDLFRIRSVNPSSGVIRTIAGTGNLGSAGNNGPAENAEFSHSLSLAVDRDRNLLYIGDFENYWVRKMDLSTGFLSVAAGVGSIQTEHGGDNGPATLAGIGTVVGVSVDPAGNFSIADAYNMRIRRVDRLTGIITTIAGNGEQKSSGDGGPATEASFLLGGFAADRTGNVFLVAGDPVSHRIRRVDAATGIINTIAGGGTTNVGSGISGPATSFRFNNGISAMAADDTTLYIATTHQIFKLDLPTGQLTHFFGFEFPGPPGPFDGDPLRTRFDNITALAIAPGGGLVISDGNNRRVRYIAPASITFSGDAGQTAFALPWVSSLSGSLTITNNPNLTTIDAGNVTSVSGSVTVSHNPTVGSIDLGDLTVAENVTIAGNTTVGSINLGSLTTAENVTINGNPGAGSIDLGDLTVAENVTIAGNGPVGSIDLGSLITVGGDLTIETTGTGAFSLSGATVSGDASLTTTGHTSVSAATAAGSTALIMINGEAKMEALLPDGAFTANRVPFSVEKLPSGGVETFGGNALTHLESYRFNFATPTLNSPGELNFEIRLAAMPPERRQALLALLHAGAELTLAVRGDAAGAPLQVFDICADTEPIVDQCVIVLWLDAAGRPINPAAGLDPAAVRFESLVGHFSTYSVVAIPPPGDADLSGTVNILDYLAIDRGRALRLIGWSDGDFTGNGVIDGDDYAVIDRAFLTQEAGAALGAAGAPVPEPTTLTLFGAALGALHLRHGRSSRIRAVPRGRHLQRLRPARHGQQRG